jgi:hypothetical protein
VLGDAAQPGWRPLAAAQAQNQTDALGIEAAPDETERVEGPGRG